MTTTHYTLRIAINGSETDDSVFEDDEPWLCRVGSVQTTEGGGGWLKEASNVLATFTVLCSALYAPKVHTVTIAVQGPYTTVGVSSWVDNSDGTAYKVVFHGNVIESKSSQIGASYTTFTAMSEMQGLFERRAHLAADTNIGARSTADDIASAHGLTIGNHIDIPTSGDFWPTDRPRQRGVSNGEWLTNAMAGTGINIIGDWDGVGAITAPGLCWRTDYDWTPGNDYHQNIDAARPWEYGYPDIGTTWRDFVAEVQVNGEQGNTLDHAGWVRYPTLQHMAPKPPTRIVDVSNGTRYWGNAQLGSASMRRNTGNQTHSINSWIDTAANCEDAAKHLLKRVGEPTWTQLKAVQYKPDEILRATTADTTFTAYAESDYAWQHASIMLGDRFLSRGLASFDNTNGDGLGGVNTYGFWPDHCPVGGDVYDELFVLWNTTLTNDGDISEVATDYNVRTVGRQWTPSGGWVITVGLEPLSTVPITDTDHGTYT